MVDCTTCVYYAHNRRYHEPGKELPESKRWLDYCYLREIEMKTHNPCEQYMENIDDRFTDTL